MNQSSGASEPGSDAELLNQIRSGEPEPFDLLRERHAVAARNLAGHLAPEPAAADDLVTRAFAQVLDAIRRGGGPTDAFRPYLLTAVRRVAHDGGGSTMVPTDEQQIPDPGQPLIDSAPAGLAASPVVTAFLSLPERWRAVLWHTEIEEVTPAEAAPLLGLSAADAAVLADRARDGLRRAYSQLQQAGDGHDDVGLADAGGVGAALRGTVAPVILGGAATAYLADLASSAVTTSGDAGAGRAGAGRAGAGPAGLGHPASAARFWPRAAGSWLAGGLRGTTARQRTLAAGTAALLAMFALAGYTLSLNPATGPGVAAGGHRITGGVSGVSGQASSPQAPPVLSPPAPTSASSASTPGRGNGPSDRTPAAGGSGASPTFASPMASTPSSAPPNQPTPSPPAPSQPAPSQPAPSPSPSSQPAPSQPTPAPTPSRPMPVGSGPAMTAQVTAQIRGFGPVGLGNVAEVADLLTVAVTGSAACGRPVQVTVTGGASAAGAQSAGTIQCVPFPRSSAAGGLPTGSPSPSRSPAATPGASPDGSPSDGAGPWWHRSWHRATSQWPAAPWPVSPWSAVSWPASPWPGHRWTAHRWPGR